MNLTCEFRFEFMFIKLMLSVEIAHFVEIFVRKLLYQPRPNRNSMGRNERCCDKNTFDLA